MRERIRFLRGLISYIGFKQTGIYYKREKRTHGESKSLIALSRMAMNAIFSYTHLPMRLVIFFTSIVAVLSGITCLFYFYQAIGGSDVIINLSSFFQPFIILILSIALMILVMIAEVVSRIDTQVKNRPQFVIKSIIRNGIIENVDPLLQRQLQTEF